MRPMAFEDLIRRPLDKIAPQISEALNDPVGSLARQPVVIGDQILKPMIGFGAMIGLTYLYPDPGVKILFGRYLFFATLILIPLIRTYWKRQVILGPLGLEYVHGGRSVFVPWPLFQASRTYTTEMNYIDLPIDSTSIDFIEHRRDGVVTGYGIGGSSQYVSVKPEGVIRISAPFSVYADELGSVIMQLAAALSDLAASAPNRVTSPAAERPHEAQCDPVASISASGNWLAFRPASRGLPRYCCRCDRETDWFIPIEVDSTSTSFLSALAHHTRYLRIEVPFCPNCARRPSRLAILAAVVTALCTVIGLYAAWEADGRPALSEKDLIVAALPLMLGGIAYFLGRSFALDRWVKPGKYSEPDGAVSMFFRAPTYRHRVMDWYQTGTSVHANALAESASR
jgi:hypothetical protein